jgi:hypothetical protein
MRSASGDASTALVEKSQEAERQPFQRARGQKVTTCVLRRLAGSVDYRDRRHTEASFMSETRQLTV